MEHFTVEELKQMAEAQHLLDSMEEIGPERRRELVAIVRALAELARENSVAREYLERRLVGVAHSLPSEVETFRACYLDGDQRESARKIGRRLHMDICTVHRHNRRVMEALLAHVFGIYGVFQDRAGRGENGA
ncbi:hypothetical protein [Intestinimonas timonensis]|uniref:hypothetical protein n=1 Tax=Intestinimonas timonensis TaxID=1689270 RepID=UPI001030C90B|nr:hypothetical protein [Intestinimonas timonensis]